jgi:8-oxo-dGTP pyrophosphatase MutT (NUDIX family)
MASLAISSPIWRDLLACLERHDPADPNELRMTSLTIAFLQAAQHDPGSSANESGHITASAWILHPASAKVLMTYHAKLDAWFQLGGHVEDDFSVPAAALREAAEESGLRSIVALESFVFDVDIHMIPARGNIRAHPHYDIRYLFTADPEERLERTRESKALAWVSLDEAARLNPSESIVRMVRKSYSFLASSSVKAKPE